jgi:hypothetical protein
VLLPECLTSRPVGVELELLAPFAIPVITPLSWDFSGHWFASFAGVDRHQPEQGRNREHGPEGSVRRAGWNVGPGPYTPGMVSQMPRWLSLPGKLAWRWFTGKALDGRPRTDAGWFTEGHKALSPESRPQPSSSLTAEVRGDLRALRTEWRELRVRRALGRWFRDTERQIAGDDGEKH